MLIKWKDRFALDHGIIDEDHQIIIEHLNRMIAALNGSSRIALFRAELRTLRRFAEAHFAREERLQVLAGYPGIEGHRAEHRALLAQLDAMLGEVNALPDDAAVPNAREVRSFLYRWILGHILDSDTKIRPFLETIDYSNELSLIRAVA